MKKYINTDEDCMDDVKISALKLIAEQEKEIERLKAEFKQLETNAEILARGVRDLNHENYELTEKVKQAQIDVLNKLKGKYGFYTCCSWGYSTKLLGEIIDKFIEEIQNEN